MDSYSGMLVLYGADGRIMVPISETPAVALIAFSNCHAYKLRSVISLHSYRLKSTSLII